MHFLERVDCVRDPVPPQLTLVHEKPLVAIGRQPYHACPVIGGRDVLAHLQWLSERGDQMNDIQVERVSRPSCNSRVS